MVSQDWEEEITPGLAGEGGRNHSWFGRSGRKNSWFSRSGRKKSLLVQQEWKEERTPGLAGVGGRNYSSFSRFRMKKLITPNLAGVGGRTHSWFTGVGGRNYSWFSRSGRKKLLLAQQEREEERTPGLVGVGERKENTSVKRTNYFRASSMTDSNFNPLLQKKNFLQIILSSSSHQHRINQSLKTFFPSKS